MSIETKEFQTEVTQLLQLVIHSLYSNKEIFLRELISNASDAIDKAKYEGLTNPDILTGNTEWKIKLITDKNDNTLTIRDNGIGMNKEEIVKSLGTIAHSGTKEFLEKAKKSNTSQDMGNLIGQFGVGFYSSFMVADRVKVISRKRGTEANEAVIWESDASSSYTVENTVKEEFGTDIILYLKSDDSQYLNEFTLRRIVGKYSDFIEYPIVTDIERVVYDEDEKPTDEKEIKEEILNSMKAIWLKDKSELSEDDLNSFYKHISKDFNNPLKTIQIKAEGTSEFYVLLFIPKTQPFNLFNRDTKYGPMLYVKRVQIMENCEELLPQYLRFISGVVDSSDLPLNVSREILQSSKQIHIIKKNIVKKILETLSDMYKNDYSNYETFYKEFGKILKEGIHTDFERKEDIAKLCLFQSSVSKENEYVTLDQYIERMKDEQKEIYFITGASEKELSNSPYIEALNEKGYEVLFMTDEFDDIIFSSLNEYKGKTLKSVLKGDVEELDSISEDDKNKFKEFTTKVKEILGDRVMEVKLTSRLKDSPAFLTTEEGAPDPQMERLLKAMGQPVPTAKRTMGINPDNQLIDIMLNLDDNDTLKDYVEILYAQCLLMEGDKPENVNTYISLVNKIITSK